MDEEVLDHKDHDPDSVVHEVEVPTTEQVEHHDGHEQPDIVQGVPTHTIELPITATMDTSPTTGSNVKYLFCKFCPYKTRFVGNLTKHVRTHTGEKPFACRYCGKRFASRSNLNYHEATHTGNKRFQCFISGCQFKTQLRESLNSHMRKIHGVLVSGDSPLPPGADSQAMQASGAPSLPMFSPGQMSSLPNLPPIQDILTAPTSLSSMTMPQNTQVNLNDVKPSVAELAQYMIALHEGTNPAFTKPQETRTRTSLSSAPLHMPPELAKQGEGPFGETSPEMGHMETDNDSGPGSPRTVAGMRLASSGDIMAKAWESQAAMMAPRLPAPTMHPSKHAPILTNMVDPTKTSSLSNELLKIFSNLGMDTPAILDLLAAQGKLHICRSCNIVFPEYSTFVLHRGCHGNEGPFQCHFCQIRFPEKFGFLTHFMQCPHK